MSADLTNAVPIDAPKRRSLRWLLTRMFVLGLVLILAASAVALLAIKNAIDAADAQVSRYDPAATSVQSLLASLLDQETGLRGYVLAGQSDFLQPYQQGLADQTATVATLRGYLRRDPELITDLDRVTTSADSWRVLIADPLIQRTREHDPAAKSTLSDAAGKAAFDRVRADMTTLSDHVRSSRLAAKQRLHDALQALVIACVVVTAVSVLIAILLWLFISRRVIAPITRLTDETRQVAGGELTHLVRGNGPTEVVQLGHDVDQMRVRILSELDEAHAARANADRTAESLARSNADLEQFAYVASHDLQEPLRKVANFCQLLERQYAEALDDRARQYIGFAVDGAKRMQVLINDLLDFSRVGRAAAELVAVDTGHAARDAVANLAEVIAEQQATIEIDPDLPTLPAVEALLVTLFQNLIGNGLKYHGDEPPLVRVSAWPESGRWVFAVSDNGIGIDPQYADRIFIIFQRLHLRDRYGGTGIGLALCKRIVEFHGGTIWLDPSQAVGSRFCFTLPEGTAS